MNSINLLALALVVLLVPVSQAFSIYSLSNYYGRDVDNDVSPDVDQDNVSPINSHRTFYDFKAFDNDVFNKTLCYFHQDLQYLFCYGFGQVTKCQITSDFGKNLLDDINVYGLELVESSDVSMVKFALHPRGIEERKWYRAGVIVDNTTIDLSITYVNSSFFDLGVLVQDLQCFEGLVNLARISTKTQVDIVDPISPNASFFGGLFITRDGESKKQIETYSFDIDAIYSYFYNVLQALYH